MTSILPRDFSLKPDVVCDVSIVQQVKSSGRILVLAAAILLNCGWPMTPSAGEQDGVCCQRKPQQSNRVGGESGTLVGPALALRSSIGFNKK
jgi:hypothetical protein